MILMGEGNANKGKTMAQIQHKNYAQTYQALGKTVHKVSVKFDGKNREVSFDKI